MELKRTPLYMAHLGLGARFVGFAGWQMPVQYSSLLEEHRRVRSSCGLFDVSHMGEIEVRGGGALAAVEIVSTNRASSLGQGQCQYTFICNEKGGVKDDALLYRLPEDRFLFCVNAGNTEKVYNWIKENTSAAEVLDVSEKYAQIALQGPLSEKVLKPLCSAELSSLRYYHFVNAGVCGRPAIVSRTGYTGEDGFEIYISPDEAEFIWDAVMDAGKDAGILPCGLGARDTLRLEMGYPLYGHELDEDTTPIEAGLGKFVSFDKEFIGKDVLARQVEKGVTRTLVGFEMEQDGIPRSDYRILKEGEAVGRVASGSFSPTLGRAIGMGYIKASLKNPGTTIEIDIRVKTKRARVAETPFYRKSHALGVARDRP